MSVNLKQRLCFWLAIFFASFALPLSVHADEIRPAYLQLTQIDSQVFDVLWKVPARGENERLSLQVRFSDDVRAPENISSAFIGGAHLQRWQISHPSQLKNATIIIDGLPQTTTEALLRIEFLNGTSVIHRITPSAPEYLIAEPPSVMQVVTTYLVLGVEHILIGIDHLLFVFVLLLLV